MKDLSRRGFLSGIAACAIAPAIPLRPLPVYPPIFAGSIGVYNGIVFRESAFEKLPGWDHYAAVRQVGGGLNDWYSAKYSSDFFDLVACDHEVDCE